MAKKMTIEQVKKTKMEMELQILDMFKQFEEDTGLKVSYINIQRKRDKKKKKTNGPEPYEPHKGPLGDVNIEVNLDVIY